ncbi:hypothetical protein Tco_1028716 [Tanacetum coccineum]|uniref:Uncharacterized protein n=1 Tax=Tanacetum coccineum TaxID=301880 RepID=A0ABQ5G1Q7_9ASTR
MTDIVRLKTERELVRIKIHDGNAFWNEIGVNAGVSKLMLLSLHLLLPVLVYAARHTLTTVRHKYALTVNPTIYTSCIKQFWATTKTKTINREVQIQALVDGKKVIVTETSVKRAIYLKDAEGTDCLPTTTIFAELERMGSKTTAWNEFGSTMASAIFFFATNQIFNFSKYIFDNMVKNLKGGDKFLMYPRFVQGFLDKQVEGMSKHKEFYVIHSHTKKVFAKMKREGKGFYGRDTPLFQSMMVQAPEELGEGSDIPTDSQHIPTTTQPSTSQPQKKQKPRRKQKKGTEIPSSSGEPIANEDANVASVSTPSNDPLLNGEDRLKLTELIDLFGSARRVESYEESLGAQEDASKQGRKIADIDADEKVTLIDETQGRNDDEFMFDIGVLYGDKVVVETEEPVVNAATTTKSILVNVVDLVITTAEVVTTASTTTTNVDELTLDQTLIEIKAAKPKIVTTAATTVTPASTRPKAKGIVFYDLEEQAPTSIPIVSSSQSQLPQDKDKGKAKMLEEEEKVARQKEEEATIALNESWDNIQAMIEVDRLLAERLQAREQEELLDEEKASLYKHSQLKNKPFVEIQKLFDKEMIRVNMFVDMDTEMKEGSKKAKVDTAQESSSKRAEIAFDTIPLATKPPMIVEYKIVKEGRIGYFQIIRADGSSRMYKDKDEGKNHAETLIDIPVFVRSFSIILGFIIIDDDEITKGVVLGIRFCKKYASCLRIMKKFVLENNRERIMKE